MPVKWFAIMPFLSFCSAIFGYENLGIRLFAGILAFVSICVFVGASFLAPTVRAKASAQTKFYTGSAVRKERTMSNVYVAHTGYNTVDGSLIYGVYAGSFIQAG